jgi:phosphoribosylformimino-5-aminoimidazole carboxamide ribotide isomerase
MKIIPAIDIIDAKCVRLTQGDYARKKIYNEDPLEVAKSFEGAGFEKLHLVDLDGAREKHIVNYKVLESIATGTSLDIDFGGGVQSDEDITIAFEAGAKQITGGSIAVKRPAVFESWITRFGAERIILGADAKGGKIAISGWQEESSLNLLDFLELYIKKNIKYVISTDVSRDGLLEGPAIQMYQSIVDNYPELQLIASGGVSNMDDLRELRKMPIYGVIVGKAIYEGRISLKELKAING